MNIADQHAVITGAGTGIGAAIARALAGAGAKVSLLGRRAEPLDKVAGEIGEAAFAIPCDVTDPQRVAAAMEAAHAHHGPIAILVNNAGAAASAPFRTLDASDWRAAMAVNCDAVFYCTLAVIDGMLERGEGRVVTIASSAGLNGYPYTGPYCAAKHAAVGLMRALAAEYGAKGITTNAVCPGFVDTEIVDRAARTIAAKTGRGEDEARAQLARMNPSGRLITPAEVAAAVAQLIQSTRTGEALEIS